MALRNNACGFFCVNDVMKEINTERFAVDTWFINKINTNSKLISDYIIVPAEVSKKKKLELLVTDPDEGFVILFTDDSGQNSSIYCKNL